MCARPQRPREFQFYTQAHFNARRAKPGAPIGAQLKIIDDDNEPTLRAGERPTAREINSQFSPRKIRRVSLARRTNGRESPSL